MNEQLKIIISAEVGKLKQGVSEAKGEINKLKSETDGASKTIKDNFKKVGDSITEAGKKIAKGVAAAGAAMIALEASTRDYRTEQAKLKTAFETAGASADTAKKVYNDLYRVLGESDTSVEAANHLAQMTTNQKELSQWTNICQGIFATFGDSLPIEGLTEAANETAKVGKVTGTLADALNWAGISEDEFNEKLAKCNSESEREKLIRETLSKTYDEAAASYEKNAAKVLAQNEAQAKLKDTLAKVGEAVAPVVTAFTNFANDALAIVTPYIQELADKYVPILEEKLKAVAEALQPIMEFIASHLEQIALIAGIILGISAAIQVITGVMAAYNAIKTAYTIVTTTATAATSLFAAANLAALAPILLVVAAIAAVIAIIVVCIKHWDQIKEAVGKAWDSIKEKTKAAVDAVVGFFGNMKDKISNKVEEIKTMVSEKFEAVKTAMTEKVQAAKDAVVEKFTAIKDGITQKVTAAKESVTSVFTGIKTSMSNTISSAKTTVLGIFDNIKTGISNKINGAKDAVKTAIDKIKGFFNFKWELPKLKMPHISISGKFSLNPPSVPKFSIAWNALGGVFDKPTIFGYGNSLQGLGEDGAEAVVPLEKNTQWLDKIADRLASKQGSVPIILQVDGKTFAKTSIDSINQLTKQTGSLGLVMI
ncbi:MAG: hypothetical protein ACI3T9_01385 [Romboutsia timonensis]